MAAFQEPCTVLCLVCATPVARPPGATYSCDNCGTAIDIGRICELYSYAAETYYYGHQYRKYYERAFAGSRKPAKPSLGFAGEVFGWMMLAILSGVVGNAAYDVVKIVVRKVREHALGGRIDDRDYSVLEDVTDEELAELFESARKYHEDLQALSKEVRAAIVEEQVSDAVAHDPVISSQLEKLVFRKEIKPEHRRKARELYQVAITKTRSRQRPSKEKFQDLWSQAAKKDES